MSDLSGRERENLGGGGGGVSLVLSLLYDDEKAAYPMVYGNKMWLLIRYVIRYTV
jgi:hypothetical protein